MTAGTCATRPPISPSASTWRASSTCWASGCRRTRARGSGRPFAPSSPPSRRPSWAGATPSSSKAFRDARGAVHALPRVPARTAACDLYDQLDRVAQPPAAEGDPGTAATSPTITRSSSCSGWRSATSKTNRARDRAKERGLRTEQRKAPGRLVEGQVTTNWKQALQQLSLVYPDRINPHLWPP